MLRDEFIRPRQKKEVLGKKCKIMNGFGATCTHILWRIILNDVISREVMIKDVLIEQINQILYFGKSYDWRNAAYWGSELKRVNRVIRVKFWTEPLGQRRWPDFYSGGNSAPKNFMARLLVLLNRQALKSYVNDILQWIQLGFWLIRRHILRQ